MLDRKVPSQAAIRGGDRQILVLGLAGIDEYRD